MAPLETVLAATDRDYLEGETGVGGQRILELLLAPFDRERQGGVLVVLHDVTEQREERGACAGSSWPTSPTSCALP